MKRVIWAVFLCLFLTSFLLVRLNRDVAATGSPSTPSTESEIVVANFGTAFPDAIPGDGICADKNGTCTIRAAVEEAGARAGRTTITFPSDITGVVFLANLRVNGNITIKGPGADVLTFSGSNGYRVFQTSGDVIISGLTIANGRPSVDVMTGYSGGGIYHGGGTLTLRDCIITGNSAAAPSAVATGRGGGIFIGDSGVVNLVNSKINNNSAIGAFGGGGLAGMPGGNGYGGGIYNQGELNIFDCTFSNNRASGGGSAFRSGGDGYGGAIYNTGTITIYNSTFSANTAVAPNTGPNLPGSSMVRASSTSGGGGIYNVGTVNLFNVTMVGNSTTGANGGDNSAGVGGDGGSGTGGGILNGGTLHVFNSTIYGNTATGGSGGKGIAGNGKAGTGAGGGISNPTAIGSTIVAKNSASSEGSDVSGGTTSQGFNLIGIGLGVTITPISSDQIGTTESPLDPLLGSLASNGGGTQTMALLPGSPALDRGKNFTNQNTDQRGAGFPRTVDFIGAANALGGDGTDIGAYETQCPSNLSPTLGTYANTTLNQGDTSVVMPSQVPSDEGFITSVMATASTGFTGIVGANAVTGAVTISNVGPVGTHTIRITVIDNCGATTAATFSLTVLPTGYEADVTPRPNGNNDGKIGIADWVQVGRFVAGLETPQEGGEFQRADCAPITTKGDGKLSISDWVQAGRYAAGLDPAVSVGGPFAPIPSLPARVQAEGSTSIVRAVGGAFKRTKVISVPILLEATGTENAFSFSVHFDPQQLFFSSGEATDGWQMMLNTTQAEQGHIGILLSRSPGQTVAPGTQEMLRLSFLPKGGRATTTTRIQFDDQIVVRKAVQSDASAKPVNISESALVRLDGDTATVVNAASYLGPEIAIDSIATVFGDRLAQATASADALPLPTTLAGTTIRLQDQTGRQLIAPLFYVSPTQINFLVPSGLALGPTIVTVTKPDSEQIVSLIQLKDTSLSLFSANADGKGVAAAQIVRVDASGKQYIEPVAQWDSSQGKMVALPIQLQQPGLAEPTRDYLVLYGTGFTHMEATQMSLRIGGVIAPIEYAGAQGTFAGLDQINVLLPQTLLGAGVVPINLSVGDKKANPVEMHIQ